MLNVQQVTSCKDKLSMFSRRLLNDSDTSAFVSFSTTDKLYAALFRKKVSHQYPHLRLLGHPVTDIYEQDWKSHCETKIGQSTFFICLIGGETHRSAAVTWEISKAIELAKPVVPIRIVDGAVQIPPILRENSIAPLSYDFKLLSYEAQLRLRELVK